MVVLELEGVEIDHCLSCGGTWLDTGELDRIAEIAGAPSVDLARLVSGAREGKRTRRRCPRCPAKLREIPLPGDPPVLADRCPRGHGLWFDRGEMVAAIRARAGERQAVVARFFADLYRSELEAVTEGE
jgi:Zn-finger nucleic acid-binding protein